MPQSSLMTWLNKPAAVKQPLPEFDSSISPRPRPEQLSSLPHSVADGRSTVPDAPEQIASTISSSLKPLPPNVELRACGKDDIAPLKRLTSLLLPIPYSDKFYREILEDQTTNDMTILAVWHDNPTKKGIDRGRLVGAIRCRLLTRPPISEQAGHDDSPMLYLSTLVLLSPYRSHGIATHMLQMLTRRAIRNHGISSVGAHVWEANADGLEWYRKRGFREVGREKDYYRRLEPRGAAVMQRGIGVLDHFDH